MATPGRVVLALLFTSSFLYGGDNPIPLRTRCEVRQHLFGEGNAPTVLSAISPFQNTDPTKKSVGLAAIYSLLLPGMGEMYAHGFSSGKYFLMAEGALWLTFATFEVYGNSLRDDARAFAVSRAGVTLGGKDEQYFIDIGNFVNIDDYNDKQARDRQPELLYNAAAGYAWDWRDDALRASYREQRIKSETMYNNRKFVVAAIIVNHVASAINAARAAIAHNNAMNDLGDLQFNATVMGGLERPHGLLLTVSKGF